MLNFSGSLVILKTTLTSLLSKSLLLVLSSVTSRLSATTKQERDNFCSENSETLNTNWMEQEKLLMRRPQAVTTFSDSLQRLKVMPMPTGRSTKMKLVARNTEAEATIDNLNAKLAQIEKAKSKV